MPRKGLCLLLSERSQSNIIYEVECIDLYLIEGYTVEVPDFPNALCTDCHIELSKKINDNGYHLAPTVDDYDPGRSNYLRSSLDCKCRIFPVVKMTGLVYQQIVKKKRKTFFSREDDS